MYVLGVCVVLVLCTVHSQGQDEQAWSRKEFPNPLVNVDMCGRAGQKSYICDPSNILRAEEGMICYSVYRFLPFQNV